MEATTLLMLSEDNVIAKIPTLLFFIMYTFPAVLREVATQEGYYKGTVSWKKQNCGQPDHLTRDRKNENRFVDHCLGLNLVWENAIIFSLYCPFSAK